MKKYLFLLLFLLPVSALGQVVVQYDNTANVNPVTAVPSGAHTTYPVFNYDPVGIYYNGFQIHDVPNTTSEFLKVYLENTTGSDVTVWAVFVETFDWVEIHEWQFILPAGTNGLFEIAIPPEVQAVQKTCSEKSINGGNDASCGLYFNTPNAGDLNLYVEHKLAPTTSDPLYYGETDGAGGIGGYQMVPLMIFYSGTPLPPPEVITGFQFMPSSTALGSASALGANLGASVGSIFPIAIVVLGITIAFFVLFEILAMYGITNSRKKSFFFAEKKGNNKSR